MSRKPSKPETRIEDYLDVMTGGDATLPQPILRIEFYYAFLAGMTVELPQPILDDEKLLAKICGMEVEAPTYIPGLSPRLYAYMAKKGGQDVQVPDPILRLERYWYDYSASTPPSEQEYTGAVPVTFVADGTPLLDYLISGDTVQSGTPTPDNPVMPQGTGERTGNLFDGIKYRYTSIADGNVWVYSTQLTGSVYRVPCKPNTTYTLYLAENVDISIWRICEVSTESIPDASSTSVPITGVYASTVPASKSATFTTSASAKYILFQTNESAYDSVLPVIMLIEGTSKIPYEPNGYKISISSANTTTPVYLGEVETTRRIKKLVLTGEESWYYEDAYSRFFINVADFASLGLRLTPFISNAFGSISDGRPIAEVPDNNIYSGATYEADIHKIFIKCTTYTSLNDWQTYLAAQYAAGTPVTVWYVLATEETAIVNEPLMRIGDYADTLSLEQAGVSIPTADGSTTLDVDTTVKPSEVYIKYRGEAVATLSALPAEVSSPEEAPEEVNSEETEEEENEC